MTAQAATRRRVAAGTGPTLPALLLLTLMSSVSSAETEAPTLRDDGPWVVRIADWTESGLEGVRARFDHIGVDAATGALRFVVDRALDRDLLLATGWTLELELEETERLRWIEAQFAAGHSLRQIPGFECYRTVEETLATGAQLALDYPDLATWTDLGDSWEKQFPGHGGPGYDLMVLKLTQAAVAGPKPDLMLVGALHAREYATAELVTRFAEALVAGYGVDPDLTWILDHHEIHLVLQANPDGRKRAESGLSWRKNANDDFCSGTNDRGIDLNRNFDFQWGCCGGSSGDPCQITFRGPSARSEPEAIVLMDYMDSIFADQRPDDLTTPAPPDAEGIYIDVHSFGEVFLSSWGFTTADPPNAAALLTLGRKYSFFPAYTAVLGSLGTVDGATKDYAYGRLGVPGYTAELGTSFFQDCTTFENEIVPGNLPALTQIAKSVRAPYTIPSGPDAIDPQVTVTPDGLTATVTATIDDTRYSTPSEPRQPIDTAELYLDAPPWDGGLPMTMSPADGGFDETIEPVELTVDLTGVGSGRHLVYLRGRDAAGNWGAFSARFVDIDSQPVFADGFESGDTSAWSATVP